ncbi:hypothetical protein BGZ63DRAFT_376011 [Mariannaea sp. PMI_226]|nr:hypothetical protein BGZ63DRAFT_376011 [Mariannaea sp. PMI_226]
MKGPTVTVQPVHPSSFTPMTQLYPVKEDSVDDFLARTEKQKLPRTSYPTYSVYPGLKTPASDTSKATESLPVQNPKFIRPVYHTNELFSLLPSEVLSLILSYLRQFHLDPDSPSCATCWMRDMYNLLMASRKWYKTARIALYEDIQLVGADSIIHKKKYNKLNQGARIMMLRRSLRANPYLASLVRNLKVPAPDLGAKVNSIAEYDDTIASLVMACPNLETLSGPTTTYDHSFKKLFHALSTRPKLKQMNWVIQASPQQKHQRIQSSTQQLGLVVPGELKRFQEIAFLNSHDNWKSLETLTINCYMGATLTPENLLMTTLQLLPSLKHLHLCNIPRNGFNDNNLLSLPALESLTLSDIFGITDTGLSAFATRANSASLRTLQLRHTPLTSLAALARILSNLNSLTTFSLIQTSSPVMPEENSFTLWMMPYLASRSLKKLHWDITAHSMSLNNSADDILARSIAAGGFPELRTLRVPNDPDGIFQDLCYPVERIDLLNDRFRPPETSLDFANLSPISNTSSPMSASRYTLFKSSSTTSLNSLPTPRTSTSSRGHVAFTNLHAARLAAQARLEAARSRPRFIVNVIDEDGTMVDTFPMAGFIGTAGSLIKYHLLPDEGSCDEKGGLVDVVDLQNDGGESLAGGREGCCGRWNVRAGVVADRKEKESWWHTERGRWTKVAL